MYSLKESWDWELPTMWWLYAILIGWRHWGSATQVLQSMATVLPWPGSWASSNSDCSSSNSWWFYPRRASGQCHCYQAYSAWPLGWVRTPGRGKVSPRCQTLWPTSPDTACSEPERSLQPSAWEPPSCLPDLFYFLKYTKNNKSNVLVN